MQVPATQRGMISDVPCLSIKQVATQQSVIIPDVRESLPS